MCVAKLLIKNYSTLVLVASKKKKAAKATVNGMYKFDDDEDAEDNGADSDDKKE